MVEISYCRASYEIKTTKISLHNNYVLRHYPELYEYLNYEILVHTKIYISAIRSLLPPH